MMPQAGSPPTTHISFRPSHAGCCSVQGGRQYNEDRHVVEEKFCLVTDANNQSSHMQLFGVFDGHGGSKVSQFCASNLPSILSKKLDGSGSLSNLVGVDSPGQLTATEAGAIQNVAKCFAEAYESVDAALLNDPVLSEESKLMGTTAVAALLVGQHLWIANCGDSRAVICRNSIAQPLTSDHKASCPMESARIARCGGVIVQNSGARLMGILAVTRAIGDHALHPHGLTPTPDVTYYRRSAADQFLILASDGLWDVLSDQEAVDLVSRVFARAKEHSNGVKDAAIPRIASNVLTRVALARGSSDNITATVVDLRYTGTGTVQKVVSTTLTMVEGCSGSDGSGASCSELLVLSSASSQELKRTAPASAPAGCKLPGQNTDAASPFGEAARRKRLCSDVGDAEVRASKVQHSLASRLNSSGCSGEVSIQAQRSGFFTMPQEALC